MTEENDYMTTARIKNSVRRKLAIIHETSGKTYSEIIDEGIADYYEAAVQGLIKRK